MLFGLALPVILANISQTLMGLVDTLMVGQLGSTPLAAVGVATLVFSAVASALKAFDVAVQTMTATLAISDGWMDTPTFSQRRAPLITGAIASVPGMTRIRSITKQAPTNGQAAHSHQE